MDRRVLRLYRSAEAFESMTPSKPAASAVRIIVPTLPGILYIPPNRGIALVADPEALAALEESLRQSLEESSNLPRGLRSPGHDSDFWMSSTRSK